MPTQASAASNHKEEEPTEASSVPVDRSSGGSVSPQPSLAAAAVCPGHSLATSDSLYVTHFRDTLKGTAAACAVPRYRFDTEVFISVYLEHCGVSLPCTVGNLPLENPLSLRDTPTHSSLMGQPKPLREPPPAGGGWRGLCCDHDRGYGRWQSGL